MRRTAYPYLFLWKGDEMIAEVLCGVTVFCAATGSVFAVIQFTQKPTFLRGAYGCICVLTTFWAVINYDYLREYFRILLE
jgi:hypothetical protein